VTDDIVEAMLANEQMDGVARYLSGGRRLQSLDETTLNNYGSTNFAEHCMRGPATVC
jgi:hypothetical protein